MPSKVDRRSPEAATYRALYKSRRWQDPRSAQLAKQPLCEDASGSAAIG